MPDIIWLLLAVSLALPIPMPTVRDSRIVVEGKATFYADPYVGRIMQNGQPYDPAAMTCAVALEDWSELAGKTLHVCNTCGGKCVDVRVTDTGYLRAWNVALDLSPAAFRALRGYGLACDNDGVMEVTVRVKEGP